MFFRYTIAFVGVNGEEGQTEANEAALEARCETLFGVGNSFDAWVDSLTTELELDEEITIKALVQNDWPERFQD